jgi:hypothetical protein
VKKMALGRMITGFITVIVGASLVPTLVVVVSSSLTGLDQSSSRSGVEDSIALTNVSNTTLAGKTANADAICSDFVMTNSTGGETLTAGNYSFNGDACNFIMEDDSAYIGENGDLAYDYTFTSGTAASSGSLLELTILFFALGVMIAGVGLSVSGLVEYGLV